MIRPSLSAALLATLSTPALADVPVVATDIAPVHALVSQVMAGVGEPELVIPPRASPHGYAMRPSEARALSKAELVVWVGPALTPWLAEPLETLASSAQHLALMAQPGTRVLAFRAGAAFEAHDHGEGETEDTHVEDNVAHDPHEDHRDHAEHEDHSDHDDHGDHMGSHDGHDAHETEGAAMGGHGHGASDPHVWLDPQNGQLWLGQIAEALAELDPDNAAQYRENAAAAQAELATLSAEIDATLTPHRDRPFIVFHDAYHYFEARFDIEAIGAISENDARTPGAARVAELRALVQDSGARCVFAEPQFNPGLIAAVTEAQDVETATLDPIGAELTPGAGLYAQLLRGMADNLADCLSD